MPLYLGIDLGTSYFKVGLFDAAGVRKGLGRVRIETSEPAAGQCVLSVDAFWRLLRTACRQALADANVSAAEIAAVSYASQANSFVLLDSTASPLTPIIIWTDARGEPVEPELAQFADSDAFHATVGFRGVAGQYALAKWRWFARVHPELWARAAHVMTISDFLTFALTGERVGDASTAAFLGLYDLHRHGWWAEALAVAGVSRRQLSTPLRPGQPCGRTTAQADELLGVPVGIPFAVGGLDHHVAAIGAGVGWVADASISTGTVLAALTLVDTVVPTRGCYHGPHVGGHRFYRLAFDPAGASQLESYQRQHAPDKSITELIALAEEASHRGSHGSSPFDAGKSNHGVEVLRIFQRLAQTQGELLRRVLLGSPARAIAATGGGAQSAFWMQITARELGVPLVGQATSELACLGASMFAAASAGEFHDINEASRVMGSSTISP